MEPVYMSENRYSYLVAPWHRPDSAIYLDDTPDGEFEQHVQELVIQGQTNLQHEEYALALRNFQDAMALILRTVDPSSPVDPSDFGGKFVLPVDPTVVASLAAKAADILVKTAPLSYHFPSVVMSDHSMLSVPAQQVLAPIADAGLKITSFQGQVGGMVASGLDAAKAGDWSGALKRYQGALELTPATELDIRGGLLSDMAILSEKAGDRQRAQQLAQQSVNAFAQTGAVDARAQSLATAVGIFTRSGNAQQAAEFSKQLDVIKATINLNPVVGGRETPIRTGPMVSTVSPVRPFVPVVPRPIVSVGTPVMRARLAETAAPMVAASALALDPSTPQLMGLSLIGQSTPQKKLVIKGLSSSATIVLDANATANMSAFLNTMATTADIGILVNWVSYVNFVAYIPHTYFYVLPMSIGDCYAGMGNLTSAIQSYQSALAYQYINKNYEVLKVWTSLARSYLDLGEQAYRNAKDDVAAYAVAKAYFSNIVLSNKTLDNNSPLYADAKFADIKARVTTFLAAADPTQVNDNPAILTVVLEALSKEQQIEAGLNFFGFGPDYAPPFSFEYLQNTARYFAQQASQTEQRYIQFKSQAENEEFRREQLNQQAEVARQSVVLEQRGVTEAQRGVDVANASFNYANVQLQNANATKQDFENARWELLELAGLEAWANAASVGEDDEVKLTISGYDYYNVDSKRRSLVVQDLTYKRTRLSQELESAKLDRDITSAQSYKVVAQAEVNQAKARVDVAQQRVKIAQLQQKYAEQNRDFLDMREFSAGLWYELAQQAKRLKQRYLDMATEIAFLMERAYNAETERGLKVIRYDYQNTQSGNLMGADILAADIDLFTLDLLTNIKTKKIPVKKSISLADSYPMQFQSLKQTGKCLFQTSFSDFDREHPGLYLAKIRNVEVVFVGITGAPSIAGTLRNSGTSRFRASDGTIVERVYPADVMVLSQYEIRQDALAFRFNPNELRLFENNGIETLWQLELPMDANDFDYSEILDVYLTVYYDGFFDPTLEANVKAALPATGSASRAFSMKVSFPDELFYLKNQGEAELSFEGIMFPSNEEDLKRTADTIRVTGTPQTIGSLTLRLHSDALGNEIVLKTDVNGEVLDSVPNSPLASLRGQPVLDTWRITITAADNPQLVQNAALILSGLDDLQIFSEYSFKFR